ncbi:MAG: GNAT family N-acetyltransferase [Bacteroidetes bacterium]|nr:GNAT family N-acetyltransferase [Bacteroidota bacterium]
MRQYQCLNQRVFASRAFHIEPIRDQDQHSIMNIRNEQLYHLRQAEPLTPEKQANYFATVVAGLFKQEKPSQLLFSFFENDEFIGYGGLVHMNWIDLNAEISFVMRTELEQEHFAYYWQNYLQLIEQVAFEGLNFHKIFTYAFDLRPHLYSVLESCGFKKEARLPEHCQFENKFYDVVYHAKINRRLSFRKADETDMQRYFDWANDVSVREHSYQSEAISFETHQWWFSNKIKDDSCMMLVFENHIKQAVGQVRIQNNSEQQAIIGISIDKHHRGKGYASSMIAQASDFFLKQNPTAVINAFVKLTNPASAQAFLKAGYRLDKSLDYQQIPSQQYTKSL